MAHHKRKRPKNRRGGCLMCKPHKMNGAKAKEKISVKRKRDLTDTNPPPPREDREAYYSWYCTMYGGP